MKKFYEEIEITVVDFGSENITTDTTVSVIGPAETEIPGLDW